MAKGIQESISRMRTLLESTSGLQRALSSALTRTPFEESDPSNMPEQSGRFYALWPVADKDLPDIISANVYMRKATMRLQLMDFCGGGDGTDEEGDKAAELMELWHDCVSVLQNPNNRSYASTGMVYLNNFNCGGVERTNNRMLLTGTFDVIYDTAVSAMGG